MISASAVADIIATYQKYGWILRRVLLTEPSNKKIGNDKTALFGDTEIVKSVVNAAWFSRPPKDSSVTWELRYLGDIPFALLEKVDENDPKFENILSGVELRLCETISAKLRLDNGAA